ncbi:MAG TPA: hypothetical protein VGM75_38095 [Pseudonocardiaceae bacterium]
MPVHGPCEICDATHAMAIRVLLAGWMRLGAQCRNQGRTVWLCGQGHSR